MVYLRFVFTLHLNGFVFFILLKYFFLLFFFLLFLISLQQSGSFMWRVAYFFCCFCLFSIFRRLDFVQLLLLLLLLLFVAWNCCFIFHLKINNFRVFFIYALINKSFLPLLHFFLLFISYLKNLDRSAAVVPPLFQRHTHTHTYTYTNCPRERILIVLVVVAVFVTFLARWEHCGPNGSKNW